MLVECKKKQLQTNWQTAVNVQCSLTDCCQCPVLTDRLPSMPSAHWPTAINAQCSPQLIVLPLERKFRQNGGGYMLWIFWTLLSWRTKIVRSMILCWCSSWRNGGWTMPTWNIACLHQFMWIRVFCCLNFLSKGKTISWGEHWALTAVGQWALGIDGSLSVSTGHWQQSVSEHWTLTAVCQLVCNCFFCTPLTFKIYCQTKKNFFNLLTSYITNHRLTCSWNYHVNIINMMNW